MSPNLSLQQQLNSMQCSVCARCIELLQHCDLEIHIFGKTLLYKLTDNNATLSNLVLVYIFTSYSNIMPTALITLTNHQSEQELYQELQIMAKLRAFIAVIERIHHLFDRRNALKTTYAKQWTALITHFNLMIFSLCHQPHASSSANNFSAVPYKLPLLQTQLILVEFWSNVKHSIFVADDLYFRTLYLLRWLCRLPNDFERDTKSYPNGKTIVDGLLNLITRNFSTDSSETISTLYTLLGFLGGAAISFCDEQNGAKVSTMTYRLMQRMPVVLRQDLSKNLNELIQKLGIEKFAIIISKMLTWPQTDAIYAWIYDLLQSVEKNGHFPLLNRVANLDANKIATQLAQMNQSQNLRGAVMILKYLLYGYQGSPQPFHSVIPSLIDGIKALAPLIEDSFFYDQLYEIVQLCHIMLFRWPGHPEAYYELNQLLRAQQYPTTTTTTTTTVYAADLWREPSEHQITTVLKRSQWKAIRPKMEMDDDAAAAMSYNYNGNYSMPRSSAAFNRNFYSGSAATNMSLSWTPIMNAKRNAVTDKAGLTNLGATCYMNSIIQALFLSDDFRQKLLKLKGLNYADDDKDVQKAASKLKIARTRFNKHEWLKMKAVTQELQRLFASLRYTKQQAVSTRKFVQLLPAPWSPGTQQDSSEFAKYLLDCIWETIQSSSNLAHYGTVLEKGGSNSKTYNDAITFSFDESHKIDPFFGGLQRNNIKCSRCGYVSCKLEGFTELALSITPEQKNSGGDDAHELCTTKMIEDHFGVECLDGENQYLCSQCNIKVDAQRYTEIVNPPKHLIICFKRFSWNYQTQKRNKKNDWVNCPLSLQIPIVSDGHAGGDRTQITYVLYATVIHSGRSAEFGHYYTIGRHVKNAIKAYDKDADNDSGVWYMFNDRLTSVSNYAKLCNVSHIYKNDVPYLLFYKRIDEENEEDGHANVNDMNMVKKEIMKDNDSNLMPVQPENVSENSKDMDEWEKKVQEIDDDHEKQIEQLLAKKPNTN